MKFARLDIFLRDNLLIPRPEKPQVGLFNPLMALERENMYDQRVKSSFKKHLILSKTTNTVSLLSHKTKKSSKSEHLIESVVENIFKTEAYSVYYHTMQIEAARLHIQGAGSAGVFCCFVFMIVTNPPSYQANTVVITYRQRKATTSYDSAAGSARVWHSLSSFSGVLSL